MNDDKETAEHYLAELEAVRKALGIRHDDAPKLAEIAGEIVRERDDLVEWRLKIRQKIAEERALAVLRRKRVDDQKFDALVLTWTAVLSMLDRIEKLLPTPTEPA